MRMRLCSTLVLTLTLLWLPVQAAPPNQDTSQTEKAKKCDETAKKRGLKGDEKATFVSSCMAAKDTASSTMSPEEKAKVDNAQSCEQQATQKGLKGKDRKSFMKTCNAAAPK
jgi:psiF repeat